MKRNEGNEEDKGWIDERIKEFRDKNIIESEIDERILKIIWRNITRTTNQVEKDVRNELVNDFRKKTSENIKERIQRLKQMGILNEEKIETVINVFKIK